MPILFHLPITVLCIIVLIFLFYRVVFIFNNDPIISIGIKPLSIVYDATNRLGSSNPGIPALRFQIPDNSPQKIEELIRMLFLHIRQLLGGGVANQLGTTSLKEPMKLQVSTVHWCGRIHDPIGMDASWGAYVTRRSSLERKKVSAVSAEMQTGAASGSGCPLTSKSSLTKMMKVTSEESQRDERMREK